VKFSRQDETRYDYWKRMEFTEGASGAGSPTMPRERGMLFLSSPFLVQAVELLERIGMPIGRLRRARRRTRCCSIAILDTRSRCCSRPV
jgi:N-acetylneuraminate synthase